MGTRLYATRLDIKECVGYGAYGRVYSCKHMNKQYAYKELLLGEDFKTYVSPILEKVAHFYGDPNFAFPYKLIYNDFFDKFCRGYMMDFLDGYKKLCDVQLSYQEKIRLLVKAREILDKFHKTYHHMHTDINPWNFLYNKDSDSLVLIDFDTCVDLRSKGGVGNYKLNDFAKVYCKYNGYDIGLDIFMFNLLTFSILNNVPFYDVIDDIFDEKYGCITNEKAIDILSRYDDIEVKTLKKEYVIDFL